MRAQLLAINSKTTLQLFGLLQDSEGVKRAARVSSFTSVTPTLAPLEETPNACLQTSEEMVVSWILFSRLHLKEKERCEVTFEPHQGGRPSQVPMGCVLRSPPGVSARQLLVVCVL